MNLLKIFKLFLVIPITCIMLSSCSLLPNISMESSRGAAQVKKYEELIKYKTEDARLYVRTRTSDKVVPKKTIMQRLGSWISRLGIIAMLLLVAGFVLAPSATGLFLVRLVLKWKRAATTTIRAISNAKAIEKGNPLYNELRSQHDRTTEILVDKVKAKYK